MTSSSSPSTLTSVPEYLPNSTLSPALTAIGRTLPSSWILPVPTATTSPLIGFSVAVSGMTMPPADLVSASRRLTMTRSCNGRSFISTPACVGMKRACVVSTQQRRVLIVGPELAVSSLRRAGGAQRIPPCPPVGGIRRHAAPPALPVFAPARHNAPDAVPDHRHAPALPLHLPRCGNRGTDRPRAGRGAAGRLREPAAGRAVHLSLAG